MLNTYYLKLLTQISVYKIQITVNIAKQIRSRI